MSITPTQGADNPAMVMSLVASLRGVSLLPAYLKSLMPWSPELITPLHPALSMPRAGIVPGSAALAAAGFVPANGRELPSRGSVVQRRVDVAIVGDSAPTAPDPYT